MKAKPIKSGGALLKINTGSNPGIATAFMVASQKKTPLKLKRILTTTDFSELSLAAVRYAMRLAKQFSAKLSLMTAVEPTVYLSGYESVVIGRSDDAVVEIETKQLARLAKNLAKGANSISQVVRYGKPVREIVMVAEEQNFDLIVLATQGLTGLKRALIGSTAEGVVRHAPCPVLIIPAHFAKQEGSESQDATPRRILVPIDFSETSAKALSYASELAKIFKGEVTLIHVNELRSPPHFAQLPSVELDKQARKTAEELLLRAQREGFDETSQTRTMIRSGTPYKEIVGAAGRLGSDLIVLTTHGHTGFDRALLGSTAERVVRHSPCPVLVVRDKAQS